jgi:imidazole glycerol-phosphate synthase subunit HisH
MKIAIIDYGIGNVRSILNAFESQGISASLTRDNNEIIDADGVILPGVGAFSHGMINLEKYNLIKTINEYVKTNKPFMGICLGMQMLFDESEEFGSTLGLGLISGKVVKLPIKNSNFEKLPHVSWNEISSKKISWDRTILDEIEENSDVYFVHSFGAIPKDEYNILSTTEYSSYEFCSSVKKDNIYGCQFHPEKSGEIGLKIIDNFLNICKEKNYE